PGLAEALAERIDGLRERRAAPEHGLERRHALKRVGLRREDAAQPIGRHAQHDRAVLEKGAFAAPLRAADQLAPRDLDLVGARTREAERRHRAGVRRPHGHDRGGRSQVAEAGLEAGADPAVAREEFLGAREVAGAGRDAVRDLELPALVEDRAATRGAANEADAQFVRGREVDALLEPLAETKRNRRRLPREEPQRRRAQVPEPREHQRLVQGHVGRAVERLGDEEPERRHPAVHRSRGWRAASVWSSRRTGVVSGASSTRRGSDSASRANWIIATPNRSSVSHTYHTLRACYS